MLTKRSAPMWDPVTDLRREITNKVLRPLPKQSLSLSPPLSGPIQPEPPAPQASPQPLSPAFPVSEFQSLAQTPQWRRPKGRQPELLPDPPTSSKRGTPGALKAQVGVGSKERPPTFRALGATFSASLEPSSRDRSGGSSHPWSGHEL